MVPFGPRIESRVRIRPAWSGRAKSGTRSPICGPSEATSIATLASAAQLENPDKDIARVTARLAIRVSALMVSNPTIGTLRVVLLVLYLCCELKLRRSDLTATRTAPGFIVLPSSMTTPHPDGYRIPRHSTIWIGRYTLRRINSTRAGFQK